MNTARAEGRDLTAEEQREFDNLQGRIEMRREMDCDGAGEGAGADGGQSSEESGQRNIEEERERAAGINELCRNFADMGLNAEELIRNGNSLNEVREMIVNHQISNGAPSSASVTTGQEDHSFRDAASDALLLRSGHNLTGERIEQRTTDANTLRGMSLERLAIRSLEIEGVNTSKMSRDQIYSALMERQFYNPTAAFPSILDQTVRKAYETGYNEANATYQEWCTIGTLSDFKKTKGNYVAGSAGEFLEVPENGELKSDIPQDFQRPDRQLKTYGRQFTMSRQAFVNDDIGFITDMPARYAKASQRTINKKVYEILYNNGMIYDGKTLFATEHKNLITTGARPTMESYKAARLLLQKQTGLDGEAINIRPEYILTPADYEVDFKELLLAPTISDASVTGKYNPFMGDRVKVIVDNTIEGLAGSAAVPWHIVGNKMDAKTIQVDFLNGQTMPTISRATVPGTLGFVWDIYLDWGISVQDFRGIVRNPGVTL